MAKILDSKPKSDTHGTQDAKEAFSLVSNEKLLAIYAAMVKCRMLEQRATLLFQQGKLQSDLHASAGREGCAAAIGVDLQPQDTLTIAAGDWLPAFVKGISLEAVFRTLGPADSRSDGLWASEATHKNILVPIDNAPPIEMAQARATEALTQNEGAIVAAFIGPGPDSLEPWHKTLASAAAKKLPIVFVHYIDHATDSAQTVTKTRAKNPEAAYRGVPVIAVDALDPVAVYRVAYEAIVRARQARGASLLACTVHPVFSAAEREEEPSEMAKPDALATMESYLKRKGMEPELHKREMIEGFSRDLDLATRFLDR